MGKWNVSRFNEDFIKTYSENSDVGYFLVVDVEYPKKLFSSHEDLPILPDMSFKTSTKSWINSKRSTLSN